MLNKEDILKSYRMDDKIFVSRILDKIIKCEKLNMTVITDFLDINETNIAISLLNKFKIKYKVFDIDNLLERKVIALYASYEEDYNFDEVKCLKVIPKTKEKLKHKDYMGMLYNSGINPSKLGDIFVIDDIGYIFAIDTIAEFIKLNISLVGNVKVQIEEILIQDLNISRTFETKTTTSASLRFDSVVASIFNLSRSEADKKISKGDLIVNSIRQLNKVKEIKESDIISFKKFGKVRIIDFVLNKKDRYIIKFDIYK